MPEILKLYPPPAESVDHVHQGLEFPLQDYGVEIKRPYVFINMVSTLDGRESVKGKAGGIGSDTDRDTMRVLRSRADAVMVGAGTLRAERMSLTSEGRRSPEPLAVLISSTGDLPLEENLIGAQRDRTVVILPDSVPQENMSLLSSKAHILLARTDGSGRVNLGESIIFLKERFHVHRLLVEGGPTLNHALISNGLANELFLTLSPRVIGGRIEEFQTVIKGGRLPTLNKSFELTSAFVSSSELFLRYRLPEI